MGPSIVSDILLLHRCVPFVELERGCERGGEKGAKRDERRQVGREESESVRLELWSKRRAQSVQVSHPKSWGGGTVVQRETHFTPRGSEDGMRLKVLRRKRIRAITHEFPHILPISRVLRPSGPSPTLSYASPSPRRRSQRRLPQAGGGDSTGRTCHLMDSWMPGGLSV